jgi:type I restriction enzyme S subunit
VQQAKEVTEKVIAATRQLRQSLMRHLFTYGPAPFARADQVKLKKTEIGLVPTHWDIVALTDIADLVSGGTPSTTRPDFWNGAIPWATPKDMKRPRLLDTEDHITELGLAEGSRLVPAGTLFVVVRGMILSKDLPVAMAAVPMAFNQDMKAILPRQEVNSVYLLYALMQFKRLLLPAIGTSAHGTRRISTSAVSDWKIPLPPANEQAEIARLLEIVDRKLVAESERVDTLDALFHSLLHHLMTGKVRVHDLDLPAMKEDMP